jgi:hypothetical protein
MNFDEMLLVSVDDHAVEPADAPEFALVELETAGRAG